MKTKKYSSERNWQKNQELCRAMSVAEFCDRFGIGRTRAYAELSAGRLRGRKFGARTLIAIDDAERWLQALPMFGNGKTNGV